MLDNPFSKCLNPKRIINPYTHETLVVPCGHCEACSLVKGSRNAFLCELESASHYCTLFVTLTYANRFIPRAQVVDNFTEIMGRDLFDSETGEFLGTVSMSDSDLERLLRKFYLFGDVPYLRKYDLQLFLKRLRYYINEEFGNIKVRYFAVGEYGPVHFRPHYHLLLFVDSSQLASKMSEIVRKSWSYGRVDCQMSQGKCSRYVASYVNSSCNLPAIFKARSLCPFSLHSKRLGQNLLQVERAQVYASSARDFIQRSFILNGKYTEFSLWRSYYAYFFPKCKGYSTKSSRERLYAYSVYDLVQKYLPECSSVMAYARYIADSILLNNVFPPVSVDAYQEKQVYQLFAYFNDIGSVSVLSDEDYTLFVNRIYIQLLLSRHFITFVCNHNTLAERKYKLKVIESFYSQLDYMHLSDFFESQKLFYESDLVDDGDFLDLSDDNRVYPYFYNNVRYDMNDYKVTPCFLLYQSDVSQLAALSVKHKKLNDLNKMFFDV